MTYGWPTAESILTSRLCLSGRLVERTTLLLGGLPRLRSSCSPAGRTPPGLGSSVRPCRHAQSHQNGVQPAPLLSAYRQDWTQIANHKPVPAPLPPAALLVGAQEKSAVAYTRFAVASRAGPAYTTVLARSAHRLRQRPAGPEWRWPAQRWASAALQSVLPFAARLQAGS